MLIFDIETAALPEAADYIGTPKAPANYKDPAKIAQYVAEKSAAEVEQAALDPDLCTIRALGMSRDGHRYCDIVGLDGAEADVLEQFWQAYREHRGEVCGYNILGFDLPVILHRSMALGVPAQSVSLARYRIGPVYDLYAILYNWGPGRGLKWVAKRYGLEVLTPDVDGADVAKMTDQELNLYMNSELHLLEQLARKMAPVFSLPIA